ncbi:SGNH/GDSL hydrolase family protein [Rhizobium nepotum]|uniref:SGNH hydrolase-type esterase domain-containing protein n=1 Tax=Rhizobium nepotum 39/7 TaxID=1368418 RepID=A0ABR5CRL1_9HYPH|nr:hypothetical protein [Rhizobium nepotum]KJF67473.1 hypothetical protein RS75_11900 [Rhizobium nepotum 39/7]
MPLALYTLTAGAFGIGVTEFVITGLLPEVSRELTVTRESVAFDAIVDFDAVLRDPARPAHPARLTPIFDSGDHLHPGDEGNQAMAEAIDLDALLGR